MNLRSVAPALALLALGCTGSPGDRAPPASSLASSAPLAPPAPPGPGEAPRPYIARPQINGSAFPDKVIAMTWDDGPDVNTLELAEYLNRERVSATFFVVNEWIEHVSSDPGWGTRVLETGHEYLPILGDLVELGHRVGNHTLNHVLLHSADAATVEDQLVENQRLIEPFLINELRLFRAPGGAWNAAASRVVDEDPLLSRLIGPMAWDVDHKDWDNSVSCRSSRPAVECERAGPDGRLRVKASVTAHRYLSAIEETGHGIVLLHDRVGHVGSAYALKIAQEIIPPLKAHGFVFAAPVLQFSPLLPRAEGRWDAQAYPTIRLGDIDGDGRADLCGRGPLGVACALSIERPGTPEDPLPRTAFVPPATWSRALDAAAARLLPPAEPVESAMSAADVDGDGRADLCGLGKDGLVCELAKGNHLLKARRWSVGADFSDADVIRFGDLNGDGRADVCGRTREGIACALSTGRSFTKATLWLHAMTDAQGWAAPAWSASIELGDINGDGRADLCGRGPDGVVCGLAP